MIAAEGLDGYHTNAYQISPIKVDVTVLLYIGPSLTNKKRNHFSGRPTPYILRGRRKDRRGERRELINEFFYDPAKNMNP